MREAKDNITQDDWDSMISEQRKIIMQELDTLTNPPMYHLEKQIWDKIVKLRTMNVEPYEVERLIRALAVMRIDGIQKIEDAHKFTAQMKNSASTAQDKSKRRLYEHCADDYERIISAVRNIDIYPPERKPSEQKKTPPKKKHRR